ncbi:autotransporter outer membrane beta-barrel domain-containing protein [Bordetella holmesii]|nr:hypothetical protein BBB42_16705 [Bordetella holmesii]AUL21338.1 hypothetical protein BTL46_16800 [Bordetella holmesii]AUL24664.1 hypothetical protein BTL48_16820 [Bordetella holmesii]AUL28002.1 hypothetical protein BTL49_16895 [Bordetella holmesii]AUL31341.1 hypothetical protein BTL50_16890 [Bordetella holmesii]
MTGNTLTLTNVQLQGAAGGDGGSVFGSTLSAGGGGAAGHGGGSVFGGVSTGAAGGNGAAGYDGGSVFGGISTGGTGGSANTYSQTHGILSANGGNGGAASNNSIRIAGTSSLTGDIYGGVSQGGQAGAVSISIGSTTTTTPGQAGRGGLTQNNTVTLIGDQIAIAGALYGGLSVNGDGLVNLDPTFTSYYQGNTLTLQGYRGTVTNIQHFENYNWVLPTDVVNKDSLIHITGSQAVQLDNTKHSVALQSGGNQLNGGDVITLIDKATGSPTLTTPNVKQGHFLVYDTTLTVVNDELVLTIASKQSTGSTTPAAVRINPTSKAFLEGRLAALAQINQGADLISDSAIGAARASLGTGNSNLFALIDGGKSRYDTGSHIKLRNVGFVMGAAQAFTLRSQSTMMVGAFVEHGNGHYDSYNSFDNYGDVHGDGRVRYTGGGALFHMNVAGTGMGPAASAPSIQDDDGLYLKAAVRAGQAKTRFDSDLIDPQGNRGQYDSKANYFSAMAGVGYALRLDAKQKLDVYGRYTWSRLGSDSVELGKDHLDFGTTNSSRVRIGTRYSYAVTPQVTPYVGLAYEREFSGNAKGTAYNLSINSPTLKGNTGIAELGVSMTPLADKQNLTMNVGLQGYVGDRQGGAANLRVRYAF